MVPETYQNPKRAKEATRKQTKEGKALKRWIAQTSSLPTLHWAPQDRGLPPGHVLQTVTDRDPSRATHQPASPSAKHNWQ